MSVRLGAVDGDGLAAGGDAGLERRLALRFGQAVRAEPVLRPRELPRRLEAFRILCQAVAPDRGRARRAFQPIAIAIKRVGIVLLQDDAVRVSAGLPEDREIQ